MIRIGFMGMGFEHEPTSVVHSGNNNRSAFVVMGSNSNAHKLRFH